MSRKKILIAVGIVFAYLSISLFLFALTGWNALLQAKQLHFEQARKYAILAKGTGYPFLLLNKVIQNPDLIVIEDGLDTLLTLPDFVSTTTLILNTYTKKEPLSVFLLEPWRYQLEEMIERVKRFSSLNEKSWIIKKYVPDDISTYISLYSQELRLFFLVTDTVIERFKASQNYKILILFQNNYELRATGGFPGSYGVLTLSPGVAPTFEIQDIYVPDGQLEDHVDPPLPIQEAFQQGFWKLRDANWHPNFPSSAENVLWFFETGTGETFDAVFAVNFTFLETLLLVTGPIYLPDKQITVDSSSLYSLLQRTDNDAFFAGSTEKKDTLSAFATQLQYRILELDLQDKIALLQYIHDSLSQKDIQLYFKDIHIQTFAQQKGLTGELAPLLLDNFTTPIHFLAINESNLGVNKANCCIQRAVEVLTSKLPETRTSIIHIAYTNPQEVAPQFEAVSGAYKAYVRIYIPPTTTISPPIIQGKSYPDFVGEMKEKAILHPEVSESFSLVPVLGYTELGFWIVMEKGQELHVTVQTEAPEDQEIHSQMYILKQSGYLPAYDRWKIIENNTILYDGPAEKDIVLP